MSKYEVLHLGKVLDKETLPCSVCKEIRVVEQEIIRYEDLGPHSNDLTRGPLG
jgi:hypothetical protein